jgi:hypothetical protein
MGGPETADAVGIIIEWQIIYRSYHHCFVLGLDRLSLIPFDEICLVLLRKKLLQKSLTRLLSS